MRGSNVKREKGATSHSGCNISFQEPVRARCHRITRAAHLSADIDLCNGSNVTFSPMSYTHSSPPQQSLQDEQGHTCKWQIGFKQLDKNTTVWLNTRGELNEMTNHESRSFCVVSKQLSEMTNHESRSFCVGESPQLLKNRKMET